MMIDFKFENLKQKISFLFIKNKTMNKYLRRHSLLCFITHSHFIKRKIGKLFFLNYKR